MRLLAATARDLMTPGGFALPESATITDAVAFLTDRGCRAAVVTGSGGQPVGVVTRTDLLTMAREGGDPAAATVRGVMTPAVFSVPEDAPARTVVEQLVGLNVQHLFVADGAGAVVGVVEPMDVLRKLGD